MVTVKSPNPNLGYQPKNPSNKGEGERKKQRLVQMSSPALMGTLGLTGPPALTGQWAFEQWANLNSVEAQSSEFNLRPNQNSYVIPIRRIIKSTNKCENENMIK